MDSIIPLGQKNSLAEYMILSGADNRPPMLDKDLYDSWKSIMELYMQNRENGIMILDLVENGPLIWPTIEENGVIRTKKYDGLSATEKIQADCDMKATNIILQGLPADIYSLVNHHRVAKDLWERVQLLMQVNTKFLNNLTPEWSKFMTDVKLIKDLHTTNFNQLYAYLEQHELHANEVRIMRERNQDPLVLVTNHQMTPPHFNTYQSSYKNHQFQQQFSPSLSPQYGSIHPTQHYSTTYPSTPHAITYPSAPAKSKEEKRCYLFREKVLLVEAQGNGKVLNEEELEFLADPGIAEAKAVLMANLSSYRSDVLSEVPISDNNNNDMLNQSVHEMPYSEPSHFVEHPDNEIHIVQDTNSSVQQDALILFVFEQLSNQVTNCNKVNNDNLIANESLSAELERYKERVKLLEERQNVDLSIREKLIMDDIIREKNAQFADFEKEINSLKQTLSEQLKEKESLTKTFNVFKNESKEKEARNIDKEIALEKKVKELDNIVCKMGQSAQTVHIITKLKIFYNNNLKQALGFQNPFYLKKAQQIRPMLYDGSVIAKETNVISIADSEETLMLEEESRSKMLLKQSDPMVLEKKVNIKPINYAELNRLSEDFGKRFVPQQELSDEQAFRLQTSHPNTDQSASSPVKIEAPRELPKVSLVNTSLKKLKYHLGQFDNVVKKRITPDALTEGEWGFEHTKAVFLKEIIPFVKTLKDIFNVFDKDLLNEFQVKDTTIEKLKANIKCLNKSSTTNNVKKDFDEIEIINIKLEHRVTKLIAENEHLKQTYKQLYDSIKPSRVHAKEQTKSLVNQVNQKSVENFDLNTQLQEKVFVIIALKNDFRKLKGKVIVDNATQVSNATTIALGMYKLDPVILAPKVKNNREAHEYYLKRTMEQAAILREVVKQAKSQNPLDSVSYSACMYVKLIQEFLSYVRDTCPDIHKPSEKLVAVTPINKKKIVRFADTVTSSGNIPKVTNRPLLSSTGVNPSTSASGSKPSGNTTNDRITRTPSSNEKNKVEVQSRKVKSSLNKRNSDSKNVCNEHVKHHVKGAKAVCSVCNECLFDANHAMCLMDHVNSMNVHAKSASKKNKKRKEWKHTRKVFNSVGYKWKPTRRTFTLVRNACPLTRLTATNKVPLRVPIPLEVVAPKHVVTKVYTRRPKVPKFVHNSKPKVVQIVMWVYYVEGLGYNLFSVGQFCDSDLEVAFPKHTCFVRNLEGVDLLLRSRGTNLYSLSIGDMMASSPICLLSKATKTKSWFWHRRLSHLNFGAINHLAKHGLVCGLPRLKFEKDHLCSACAMGKSKKQSYKPKFEDTNQEKLYLLHMDLCGPMRVKFLASKDEAPDFIIKFMKMIQIRLNAIVRNIRTDNGTVFVNQTLRDYYEQLTALASEQSSLEPALHEMTPATPSSGLVPNPTPSAPFVPPSRHEWDLVFQPVFDEFFTPPASVASQFLNDPYFGIPIPETVSEESSSSDVIPTTVHSDAPIS
ncbi:retrovirus-related pol polyprotein from transposon TNT 1-94 [Tanacetum coccineum]